MSDLSFWLLVCGGIAVFLVAVAVVLERIGRADREQPWVLEKDLRPQAERDQRDRELDAITRGKDPRR